MLKLEFSEADQRKIRTLADLSKKLEANEHCSVETIRAHEIMQHAVARMVEKKFRELPWEE